MTEHGTFPFTKLEWKSSGLVTEELFNCCTCVLARTCVTVCACLLVRACVYACSQKYMRYCILDFACVCVLDFACVCVLARALVCVFACACAHICALHACLLTHMSACLCVRAIIKDLKDLERDEIPISAFQIEQLVTSSSYLLLLEYNTS